MKLNLRKEKNKKVLHLDLMLQNRTRWTLKYDTNWICEANLLFFKTFLTRDSRYCSAQIQLVSTEIIRYLSGALCCKNIPKSSNRCFLCQSLFNLCFNNVIKHFLPALLYMFVIASWGLWFTICWKSICSNDSVHLIA